MSIELRKIKKHRVPQTASGETTRIIKMTSHENPASSVVEFTCSKKENTQHGVTNAINVEEEITLQQYVRNLESA